MTTGLNLKIANHFFACHCDYAHACYSLAAKGSKVKFVVLIIIMEICKAPILRLKALPSEVDCWALTKPRHSDSNYTPIISLQFTGGGGGVIMKCTTKY